jgi:hypothetical protein
MRTYVAGAYRTAEAGVQSLAIETFRFAVEDVLLGGQGWTLAAMREDPRGTVQVNARGNWDHHLAPGNWQLITPTDIHILSGLTSDVSGGSFRSLDVEVQGSRLRCRHDGRVDAVDIPQTAAFSMPLHALTGSMIRRLARTTELDSFAALVTLDPHAPDPVHLARCVVEPVGRTTVQTPDGEVAGNAYRLVSAEPSETDETVYVLGRDGLLAAVVSGSKTVWRVPG